MGKTKKRMLSILMAMTMLLGLAPATAYATEDYVGDLYVCGKLVTEDNADDILGDGKVSYDYDENTLTLNGAALKHTATLPEVAVMSDEESDSEGSIAAIYADGDLRIELKGENSITVDTEEIQAAGISVEGALVIDGKSMEKDTLTVNVTADNCDDSFGPVTLVAGIAAGDAIYVNGAAVTVTAKNENDNGFDVASAMFCLMGGVYIGDVKAAEVDLKADFGFSQPEDDENGKAEIMNDTDTRVKANNEDILQKEESLVNPIGPAIHMQLIVASVLAGSTISVSEGSTLKTKGTGNAYGAYAGELDIEPGSDVEFRSEEAALLIGYNAFGGAMSPAMVLYANGEAWDGYSAIDTDQVYVICKNAGYDAEKDLEPATVVTFEDALKLTVEADKETVKPGDEVLFTITLENMMSERDMSPRMMREGEDEYINYVPGFIYGHIIGSADFNILVKDSLDDDQYADGYFCDADGNRIESIYDIAVNDVILVMNTDIEGFNEETDEYGREERGAANLYGGEKAVLHYKAVVSEDAKSGEAVNTVEVRTLIGYKEDDYREDYVPEAKMSSRNGSSPEGSDVTFASAFEYLGEDENVVMLNPVATASVDVETSSGSSSRAHKKPDVEVIGEGADVHVGKKFVSVKLEDGYMIEKVTVNGESVEVPESGRIVGLNHGDDVLIYIAEQQDAPAAEAEQKNIVLTIDKVIAWVFDEYVTNDVAPIISNGRTVLPARFVAEALGGVVAWDEAAQKVTITKEGTVLEIFIDEPFATVNGEPVELDAPAFIENERTYLPLRFIAEYLGAEVVWDADAKTVTITPGK